MESQRSSEAHGGELVGFPTDDLERKLEAALATLRAANVPIDGKRVDHACYRSATKDEYFAAKRAAEAGGATLLVESMIGGRPIATYALARPISTHAIALLELPAPKPGRPYATGWEHAEIALGDDLEAVAASLRDHASLDVDFRAWRKAVNRDVSVGCPGGFAVKLHAAPLDEVVAMELREGLVEPVPADYWDAH